MIHCLGDTNALIKYYIDLPGSDIIRYLIDKNPSVAMNITNVHITEMIGLFYKLRANGIITSDDYCTQYIHTFLHDIKEKKILVYDFSNQHILDFDVFEKIATTPAPLVQLPYTITKGILVKGTKDDADTADSILLVVMREMHLLSEGKSFLVTCDAHVKAIAHVFGLPVIDPEKVTIDMLPTVLNLRSEQRKEVTLNALCTYENDVQVMPVMRTINISERGLCLRTRDVLIPHKNVVIDLVSENNGREMHKIRGSVQWVAEHCAGIKSETPISLDALLN
ncbi:MAG: hypothetical protein KKH94_06575 [Candidatus Omnitrophica bacterium]|nr:hypothetical protein [Candidatus Omnitrophota bacterium]